jgi:hypothetical protein
MCRGALETLEDKVELRDKFLLILLNLQVKNSIFDDDYFFMKDMLTGRHTCVRCKKEKSYFVDFEDYEAKRICKKCSEKIGKER